jgi:hypothetical protein
MLELTQDGLRTSISAVWEEEGKAERIFRSNPFLAEGESPAMTEKIKLMKRVEKMEGKVTP